MKNLSPNNQVYLGIAILLAGVIVFQGGLEIIAVIGGALLVLNGQRQKRFSDSEED